MEVELDVDAHCSVVLPMIKIMMYGVELDVDAHCSVVLPVIKIMIYGS